jgi:hypothetical protein
VALPLAPGHALYGDWVPPRAVAGS